jgi:hypothetical protein
MPLIKDQLMLWLALRQAAVARHYWVWLAWGAKPESWAAHMALIRSVYGV